MLGKLFLFALIVEILKWIWYFVSMEFLRKCSVDPWKCLNAGQAPQIFHFTKNRKDFVFKIQQSEQKIRYSSCAYVWIENIIHTDGSITSIKSIVSFVFFLFCSHNAQPQSQSMSLFIQFSRLSFTYTNNKAEHTSIDGCLQKRMTSLVMLLLVYKCLS